MSNHKKNVERVTQLLEERKKLFKNKNENYGCSYIKAGKILTQILDEMPLTLRTSQDHIAYQIITRLMDKLLRYCNLRFTGEHDKVGEKISDTLADLGLYSFMLAEIEENGIDEYREIQDLSGREESSNKG